MKIDDIKLYLKQQKITYQQLSELSGVSLNTLKQIFRGRTKNPRMDTMQAIEMALGIRKNETPQAKLSHKERELLAMFNALNDEGKALAFGYMQGLFRKF